MGISGLLGLLKSIQTPCNMRDFAGQTVGVDGYGWLHRGLVSCSTDLAVGKPTRKYADFALTRVKMLLHFRVKPFIVLDGDYLPSKAATETARGSRRQQARAAGMELLRQGRRSEAHAELQKAVDLTPEMVSVFIDDLRQMGIPFVVAPYEADAQLVYLEKHGVIDAILSEDSDLLVFGAKRLITKLDQYGAAISIDRDRFPSVSSVSLAGWSDSQFRTMAILAGCDYLRNIPGVGLKKAHGFLRRHGSVDRMIAVFGREGSHAVPDGYLEAFQQAEDAFRFQWVFCPRQNKAVPLSDPVQDQDPDPESLPHLGVRPSDAIVRAVAAGQLDPHTKMPFAARTGSVLSRSQPSSRPVQLDSGQKSISAFFQPARPKASPTSLGRSQSGPVTTSTPKLARRAVSDLSTGRAGQPVVEEQPAKRTRIDENTQPSRSRYFAAAPSILVEKENQAVESPIPTTELPTPTTELPTPPSTQAAAVSSSAGGDGNGSGCLAKRKRPVNIVDSREMASSFAARMVPFRFSLSEHGLEFDKSETTAPTAPTSRSRPVMPPREKPSRTVQVPGSDDLVDPADCTDTPALSQPLSTSFSSFVRPRASAGSEEDLQVSDSDNGEPDDEANDDDDDVIKPSRSLFASFMMA